MASTPIPSQPCAERRAPAPGVRLSSLFRLFPIGMVFSGG